MSVLARNITGEVIYVGAHRGEGRRVEVGEMIELDGVLIAELDDAAVVGDPADESSHRAWPSSVWQVGGVRAQETSGEGEN